MIVSSRSQTKIRSTWFSASGDACCCWVLLLPRADFTFDAKSNANMNDEETFLRKISYVVYLFPFSTMVTAKSVKKEHSMLSIDFANPTEFVEEIRSDNLGMFSSTMLMIMVTNSMLKVMLRPMDSNCRLKDKQREHNTDNLTTIEIEDNNRVRDPKNQRTCFFDFKKNLVHSRHWPVVLRRRMDWPDHWSGHLHCLNRLRTRRCVRSMEIEKEKDNHYHQRVKN